MDNLLDSLVGTREFLDLVKRFQLHDRFDQVLQLAVSNPSQSDGIDAVRMLLASGQGVRLSQLLKQNGAEQQLAALEVLGRSADNRALPLLRSVMTDDLAPAEARRAAVHGFAQVRRRQNSSFANRQPARFRSTCRRPSPPIYIKSPGMISALAPSRSIRYLCPKNKSRFRSFVTWQLAAVMCRAAKSCSAPTARVPNAMSLKGRVLPWDQNYRRSEVS